MSVLPGTIMTDRLAFDQNVTATRKTRSASIHRGAFTFFRCIAVPTTVAYHWWDSKPVYYLCTGSMMTVSNINRNVKRVGPTTVPRPAAVTDSQCWMGGVDVNDQCHLQKLSLQTSTKFQKYNMSLFLGLVYLALVNAYLSHKATARLAGTNAMKRGEWYCVLQNQLLQLKTDVFAGALVTPPSHCQKRKRAPVRHVHEVEQSEDWETVSGVQKRHRTSCKVSALRGEAKICFAIWHEEFDGGRSSPAALRKQVVLRRPGQAVGQRKKTRRELQLHNGGADEEGEGN